MDAPLPNYATAHWIHRGALVFDARASDQARVLVAGAMPHTYPAGFSHHDVIADVLSVVGKGETGFSMPEGKLSDADELEENVC